MGKKRLYSRSRNGEQFFALRTHGSGRYFLMIKKKRDFAEIDQSVIMQNAIKYIGSMAIYFGIDVITTPPASSNEIGFAEYIAKKIAISCNKRFEAVFSPHVGGKGKYCE